jgi:hypothetical protein
MAKKLTGEQIVRRWNTLASKRSTWVNHWQECADVGLAGNQSIATQHTKGQKNTDTNFDTTAITSNQDMAAGLYSWLFAGRWFFLRCSDMRLNEREDIKSWMNIATQRLHEAINASNFVTQIVEHLMYLGIFGTGCLHVSRGQRSLLNFRNYFIGSFCIEENSGGVVDTLYRYFSLTARQAVQEFGLENLSETIRKAYQDTNKQDNEFYFVHALYPRTDIDPDKIDNLNMNFASVYVEYETKHQISESGYHQMPFLVDRFYKLSGEDFGRSPAMNVLPDIKMASTMNKDNLLAVQKAQNPPILMPNDGSAGPAVTRPGGITYFSPSVSADNRPQTFYTGADIRSGKEEISETRRIIRKAFYGDLFEILDSLSDKGGRTATEILKRIEEKLLRLTPVSGRMQAELGTPLIELCLNILYEAGQLPPLPEGVDSYEIEYVSKLSLTLKRLEIQAMADTLEFISPMAAEHPEIMDNYDLDKIARGVAENNGANPEWIRPIEAVEAIRLDRAKRAAQQQALEMGSVAADAAQKINQPVAPGSPLESAIKLAA